MDWADAIALELPGPVYDDVRPRIDALRAEVERLKDKSQRTEYALELQVGEMALSKETLQKAETYADEKVNQLGAVCDDLLKAEGVIDKLKLRHQHPSREPWDPDVECAICKALAAYDEGKSSATDSPEFQERAFGGEVTRILGKYRECEQYEETVSRIEAMARRFLEIKWKKGVSDGRG